MVQWFRVIQRKAEEWRETVGGSGGTKQTVGEHRGQTGSISVSS